jgi:DNA-binding XRE family transcriptional regulator
MNDTIANRLRCLRADHDMSQEKLAEELDVSRTTVCHVENGDRMPSLFVVMAYAEYFSVSVDWILYGKEYEE